MNLNKISPLIIASLVILQVVFSVGQFLISGNRSSEGDQISIINNQTENLTQQNIQLQNQIYSFSSLEKIRVEAMQQNMVPGKIVQMAPFTVAQATQSQP